MDGSQIYRFLNKVYKKIGIKYSGAHILRHTLCLIESVKYINYKNIYPSRQVS